MEDYGFYVILDIEENNEENNKENNKKDNLFIDNEELIYYRDENNIELVEDWTFKDTLKCIWFIFQVVINRHTHINRYKY